MICGDKMDKIIIDGNGLTLEELLDVARKGKKVEVSESAIERINYSRSIIDEIVESKKTVYGVNTGFGSLAKVSISKDYTKQLQENLIRSHASGFGDPLDIDQTRAVMLVRINSLIKGYSGIRLSVINTLVEMLNRGVHPVIPNKGSLGASGDLAPLSHMVLPLLGYGRANYKGEIMEGKEAMKRAGISPLKLESKEGLALINGTSVLTAIGALALYDAIRLEKFSDIIAALTLETQEGIIDAFDHRLHEIRPHKGQMKTAENIRALTEGSEYLTRQGEKRVQDEYSLRCIPQVHGATKEAIEYVKNKVEIEINSVTDNPIVTLEGDVISGGNFHGEMMAIPFDYLCMAISEIGNISERRMERLINGKLSNNPSFLVKQSGINSGFMIAQYAAASLVSENKILSHPASVDSIPSSENQEDIVSMGTIAARKAYEISKNVHRILATELLAACQAIDFKEKKKLGIGSEILYKEFRKRINFINEDKEVLMYEELDKACHFMKDDEIIGKIENAIGIIL